MISRVFISISCFFMTCCIFGLFLLILFYLFLFSFLSLEEAEKSGRNVYYTGLELYPLEWQLVEQLGYISANEQLMTGDNQCPVHELFKQLHTSPWEEDVPITPHFTLRKVQKDFNKLETETEGWKADVIYFDAFAPEKQPEMWSQELFNRLYVLLNNGLTTVNLSPAMASVK